MLQPSHLPRYAQLALLFTRYGRRDFHVTFDPAAIEIEALDDDEEAQLAPGIEERAKAFANSLKEMGPTFVKFGQLLSSRPDIVPPPYIRSLEELQDHVEPFSFAEVEAIIEEELGTKVSKIFPEFDNVSVAAASLGQVHQAVLRDGRDVVIKVQRPDIRPIIEEDLKVFDEIAQFLEKHSSVARKMNLIGTVRQARRTLVNELNYLHEARNMATFRRNLAEFPAIYVPSVLRDLTTARVLTMEMIHGKKVSKITPLEIIDHDYAELAVTVTHAYLKQICVDGVWHSDPHPGNVFVREGQLVLLDFGMVSRIAGEMQDEIVKLLLGLTENRGEEVAEVCMRVGTPQEGFDRDRFVRDVSEMVGAYHDADLNEANAGRLVFQVIGVASANELQVPAELALLAKTLLQLDDITRRLDPEFNPREAIHSYTEQLIGKKVKQKLHPRNYYTALLDLNALALELPRRLRSVVNQAETGELGFRVSINQLEQLLKALTKIANRLTVGLVIAAIIIGSALIMDVRTSFSLFGYPGLAVLGFIAASALGFYLIITILVQDRRDREKAKKQKN